MKYERDIYKHRVFGSLALDFSLWNCGKCVCLIDNVVLLVMKANRKPLYLAPPMITSNLQLNYRKIALGNHLKTN